MAGTKSYDVCFTFHVIASDDDEARNKVASTLAHDTRYSWDWIYTTLTDKGETNE
jgi:hypothetical protein